MYWRVIDGKEVPIVETYGTGEVTLLDWMDTVFFALHKLRTWQRDPQQLGVEIDGAQVPTDAALGNLSNAINDISHRLLPRLRGIEDALIRAHAESGATIGHMANAMDVARSTAQARREAVVRREPSAFEKWATGSQRADGWKKYNGNQQD